MPIVVLVVDDDPFEGDEAAGKLGPLARSVVIVRSPEAATAWLELNPADVVFTDVHFSADPGREGLQFLALLRERFPFVVAVAMSVDLDVETAKLARKLGAHGFLRKPLGTTAELAIAIELATEGHRTQALLARAAERPYLPPDIAAACPDGLVMPRELRRLAGTIAKSPMLAAVVYGETGTGKEEFAKLVHRLRCAKDGPVPFVSVNCATLNSSLAESLLFGHVKGAFSGADRTTQGLIGEANGGLFFLDEIHALTHETQLKLLRVLNDGSYSRVGSSTVLRSDFQVLAASTKDLDDLVDQGGFLLDLRARLSGFDVALRPLRERLSEIPQFLGLFFARARVELPPGEFEALAERCRTFYWQGNVRQLFKALQALVLHATCNEVALSHLDLPVYKTMLAPGRNQRSIAPVVAAIAASQPISDAGGPVVPSSPALVLLERALVGDVDLREVMKSLEKSIIEAAMQRHSLLRDAYAALGIGRNTFHDKRKRLGISLSQDVPFAAVAVLEQECLRLGQDS